MILYRIRLWYGEPDTGLLLMRNTVVAETEMDAIHKATLAMNALLEPDWDEYSFKVEPVANG